MASTPKYPFQMTVLCLSLPPENPPKPREIFVDRPFAVAVATPDGLPLFVGLVRKPEED